MTETIRFEVAGLTFHGLCFGPADGIPVLALHGWLDNAASFTRLGALLTGCRVIAIDQRGQGMTNHLNRPYHIWNGVPDVIGILDTLGWEQAILLGHSMGAAVAALVASAYPDRIQALWLVEGLGPWTYPDGEAPALLRNATDELRWASDRHITLLQLFRLDESQVQVCIRRLEMPVSLGLGDQGFFKDPLFLPERIKLCRDIGVETLKGGHHLHLEGAEGAIVT